MCGGFGRRTFVFWEKNMNEKISVHLAFDFSRDLRHISRLFGMADDISFLKDEGDRDIAADLDFYTHVVVKNGLSVAP